MTTALSMVSTAHYIVGTPGSNVSAGNVATVPTPDGNPVEAQVLGGAGTTGGVTADFPETITPGTIRHPASAGRDVADTGRGRCGPGKPGVRPVDGG